MSGFLDALIDLLIGSSNSEKNEDSVMNGNSQQETSTAEKIVKGVISFTGSCAGRCMQTGCDKSMAHHSGR